TPEANPMSTTISITMVFETCLECGVVFGMPEVLREYLLKDGEKFFCPNGHEQWFCTKEEKEKQQPDTDTRRELVLAIHRAEQAEAKAAEAMEAAERSAPAVNAEASTAAPLPAASGASRYERGIDGSHSC